MYRRPRAFAEPCDVSGPGGDAPPRQQQERDGAGEHRAAEDVVGAAPSGLIDEDLRQRNQHEYAGAGRGRNHGQSHGQAGAEPAVQQQRACDMAEARAAEA